MKNYANSEEHKKVIKEFDYIFSKDFFVKNDLIKLTDKLTLNIDYFVHNDKKNGTSTGGQAVALKNREDEVIFFTKIIGRIFYQLIEHSTGCEYFIVGASIHDYILYNVSKNITMEYIGERILDQHSHRYPKQELYWYIVNLFYNPLNNLIVINGQDILNCSRVSICDFTDINSFPLIFYRMSNLIFGYDEGENHIAKNWTKENHLKVEVIEESFNTIYLTECEIRKEIEKLT